LLADWLTIRENFGSDITGRKFVYLGDGNNMSHAWLIMGAIMGAHVVAATPEGSWSPDSQVIAQCTSNCSKDRRSQLKVLHDPEAASRGCERSLYRCLDVYGRSRSPSGAAKITALSHRMQSTAQLMNLAAQRFHLHALLARTQG
jgi:ornithine carbamoyltransferase